MSWVSLNPHPPLPSPQVRQAVRAAGEELHHEDGGQEEHDGSRFQRSPEGDGGTDQRSRLFGSGVRVLTTPSAVATVPRGAPSAVWEEAAGHRVAFRDPEEEGVPGAGPPPAGRLRVPGRRPRALPLVPTLSQGEQGGADLQFGCLQTTKYACLGAGACMCKYIYE